MTEIEIGNMKFPLRATIGAWKRFEDSTGKRIADLQGKDDNENVDVTMFCVLAFHFVVAGCKANNTEFKMSLEEFLDSIEVHRMPEIAKAIHSAMGANQKKRTAKQT
jgi:hypothetical protein